MAVDFNEQAVSRARLGARVAALLVAALALFVFVFGWIFGWETAKSLVPNGPTMKAHTALAHLAGAAIVLLNLSSESAARTALQRALGLVVLLTGAATLVELLTGAPVALDRLVVNNPAMAGRMSPAAAVAFTLIGLAALAQTMRTRLGVAVAQTTVLMAFTVAFLALIGFVFNVAALYRVGFYLTFSLHSNVCMMLVCTALLCSRPTEGLMRLVVADGPNGVLVRNLVPAALILPMAFGWLALTIQQSAHADVTIGFALFSLLVTASAAGLILLISEKLRVADRLQRKALDELRTSEKALAAAQRIASIGSFSMDFNTGKLIASQEMLRMYGLPPDQVHLDREILLKHTHPDDRARALAMRPHMLENNGRSGGEFRIFRADGTERIVHVEVQLQHNERGEPVSTDGAVHDITARREIELALQSSEQRFRSLFDYAPLSLWEVDFSASIAYIRELEKNHGGLAEYLVQHPEAAVDGILRAKVIAVNDFTLELFRAKDRTELLNSRLKTFTEETPALLAQMFLALSRGEKRFSCEVPRVTLDGKMLLLQSGWAVVPGYEQTFGRVIYYSADITERKRLEQQLLQSQKVESIGRLAGGVAHDFNNLLTSIIGFSELAKLNATQPERLNRNLDRVLEAAQRGATLTQQLLAYARKKIVKMEVINLNRLIVQMEPMLHRLIGEDVELVVKPGPQLGSVKADPGSLDQIIMNLAVNARDAMPTGGKLTIETLNTTLSPEYAAERTEVAAGDYVMLVISDCGTGMSPEIVSHIFEPFFTTKPVGKGTGLGLAMCQGIVKQAGGHIAVYSELGKGTSVKIYLPLVAQAAAEDGPASHSTAAYGGTETILVVEDDLLIRECAMAVLTDRGYDVLLATDGVDALRVAAEIGRPIQLLVTDVVMPKMGGRELATQIKAKYPEVKVLFASGYTENAIVHHGVLKEGVNFIQKPYSPSAFARAIRAVLDGD